MPQQHGVKNWSKDLKPDTSRKMATYSKQQTTSCNLISDKVPRQKACLYASLILCTAAFIFFYSYPLNRENWNLIGLNVANGNYNAPDREEDFLSDNKLRLNIHKLATTVHENATETVPLSRSSENNEQQAEETRSDFSTVSLEAETSSPPSSSHANRTASTVIISVTSEITKSAVPALKTITAENKNASHFVTQTAVHDDTFTTENETPTGVPKGFLVYSNQCRIPDLDPLHPSIRNLVEITPPLNCSIYEMITKTNGSQLILDQETARKVAGGNFSCCYRSVYRDRDGSSDNSVGFGKDCVLFADKVMIQDEFISVECKYPNETTFYKEFHSFIHDKASVEERCRRQTDPRYSVLIVGIDAVSRLNMHRQLSATARYLLHDMEAIEMYGFNKVGDNTFPNLIPLLMGYDERELPRVCWETDQKPLDDCNFLWKRYAERGYRTFYAEDTPHISSFNYLKKGFYKQPTDYYFRHFIKAYEDALGRDKRMNCHLCVGSISETEAVLHWLGQFASHFRERSYFAFTWINSLTHDFLNMGSSADYMYERFFRTLHQSGAFDRTIIVVMGDHGMRWGEIRQTYIGRLEERLPMLLISLPPKFQQEHPEAAKALRLNSHRLVTPFDLHATLVNLLHMESDWIFSSPDKVDAELAGNFTSRANSLFFPVPEDRSCDDAFIEEHWCTCESSLPIDVDNKDVENVVQFLVKHINKILAPVSNRCNLLKLKSISDARIWQPPSEHEGHTVEDKIYTAIFESNPGGAIFEGTVKIPAVKPNFELLGTISRLNLYGNQSSCIDDAILRKYCYCL